MADIDLDLYPDGDSHAYTDLHRHIDAYVDFDTYPDLDAHGYANPDP